MIQDPNPQVKDQGNPIPRSWSPTPTPVVHIQEKDRRREKPKHIPQDKNQKDDLEAGPDPSTQAYREGEPSKVERQDAQEGKPSKVFPKGKYVDKYARKPREHLKT